MSTERTSPRFAERLAAMREATYDALRAHDHDLFRRSVQAAEAVTLNYGLGYNHKLAADIEWAVVGTVASALGLLRPLGVRLPTPREAIVPDKLPLSPQEEIDAWNAAHKTGDPVTYEFDDGSVFDTRTYSQATVLSGHPAVVLSGDTAVIWVEGKAGCVLLSRVKPRGQ